LIILAAVAVALAAASIQYIPPGMSGAAERRGSIEILEAGIHFAPPWDRAATYPVEPARLALDISAEVPAGEVASRFELEISVDPAGLKAFHKSQGPAWRETLIEPLLGEFLKRNLVSANKAPGEVTRGDLEEKINEGLAEALEPYGLALHSTRLISLEAVASEETARIAEFAKANGGRVIIIGSDAFDWQIYEEVSKQVAMPNIERLRTDGATGVLMSMEPLVSPMIWTTMATGMEPQRHGIIDFVTTDEETGENIPITSTMRRVPALWNILTRYGLSSGFIGWLGTYPAEAVLGFMISDRIVFHTFDPRWQKADEEKAYDNTAGLAYPDGLIDEIEPLISGHGDVGPAKLSDYVDVGPSDVERSASTFDRLDPLRNLRLILSSAATYERIARYTYEKYRPDLFSVYLDEVDNVCHLFIKHMAPHTADVSPSAAARYGQAVAASYAHVDTLIGEWLDMIDEDTTLMLISDHGFKSGDIRPKGASAVGGGQAVNWHRIAGAIALYGNGVRRGAKLEDARVLDITPTVLAIMGLPAAEDMPGRVLEEAFDPEWLARVKPAGRIESYGERSSNGTVVRRKDEEEAMLERLQALGYVSGGSTGLKRLAGSHFSKGEFDRAIEIWNDILVEEPGNAEVMTSIGNALLQKGELLQALETLEKAVAADPRHLPSRNMLGMCYINLGRMDDALRAAQEVLALDAGNPEAYFNLGVVYRLQGRYDQALSAFKRSVDLRGDYDESRINLASEYVRRGDFEAAKNEAAKALQISPNSMEARYLLGRIYQGTRNADSAAFWYREALNRDGSYADARIALATVLAGGGQPEEARRELERGLEYSRSLHIIHINLGLISRQLGDLSKAESHFNAALDAEPDFTPAMLDLAELYIAQNRHDKARRQLEAALRVDPGNDRARRLAESLR
jgi:tetratricopeptide (TPR) repeat protein